MPYTKKRKDYQAMLVFKWHWKKYWNPNLIFQKLIDLNINSIEYEKFLQIFLIFGANRNNDKLWNKDNFKKGSDVLFLLHSSVK